MDDLELLIDLHRGGTRQGPGGDDETRLAIELSGLRDATDLQLDEHWSDEYPEVATASTKTAALEQHGYSRSATAPCPSTAGWTTTTGRCSNASPT